MCYKNKSGAGGNWGPGLSGAAPGGHQGTRGNRGSKVGGLGQEELGFLFVSEVPELYRKLRETCGKNSR